MTGTIKRLVVDRGFGFLRDDDSGVEYFFHYSAVQKEPGWDFARMKEGDSVEFEVGEGTKGPRAEKITRL